MPSPCFQRSVDRIIEKEVLSDTFAYFDNIHVDGGHQAEHDKNLEKICKPSKEKNLTHNKDKCTFSTTKLKTLGFVTGNGEISQDPEHLKPLKELSHPHDAKSLNMRLDYFRIMLSGTQNCQIKLVRLTNQNHSH